MVTDKPNTITVELTEFSKERLEKLAKAGGTTVEVVVQMLVEITVGDKEIDDFLFDLENNRIPRIPVVLI